MLATTNFPSWSSAHYRQPVGQSVNVGQQKLSEVAKLRYLCHVGLVRFVGGLVSKVLEFFRPVDYRHGKVCVGYQFCHFAAKHSIASVWKVARDNRIEHFSQQHASCFRLASLDCSVCSLKGSRHVGFDKVRGARYLRRRECVEYPRFSEAINRARRFIRIKSMGTNAFCKNSLSANRAGQREPIHKCPRPFLVPVLRFDRKTCVCC